MALSIRRLVVVAIFLFCMQTERTVAQNQPARSQQTFRTTTRLVVVDVVATDDNGLAGEGPESRGLCCKGKQ